MAPSLENLKKNWVVLLAGCLLSFVTANYTSHLGATETDKREYEKRMQDELLKKANLEYVDKRFIEAEKIQNAYFQGISDMFVVTQQQLKDIKEDIRSIRK